MQRIYHVILKRREDVEDFANDMETPGGNLYIPQRAVERFLKKSFTPQIDYYLTDQEAEIVGRDPRVLLVELNAADRGYETGTTSWTNRTATFSAETATNNTQWGILRTLQKGQIPLFNGSNTRRATVNTGLPGNPTGKDIDIVVMDGHVQADHPEFEDANGRSRVIQYDWIWQHGAEVDPDFRAGRTYNYGEDFENKHGTHVASTIAGRTQGWAIDANIYNIGFTGVFYRTHRNTLDNVFANLNDRYTYCASVMIDYIRAWHRAKPINPRTGKRNPTIINNSWGYSKRFTSPVETTGDLNNLDEVVAPAVAEFPNLPVLSRNGFVTSRLTEIRHKGQILTPPFTRRQLFNMGWIAWDKSITVRGTTTGHWQWTQPAINPTVDLDYHFFMTEETDVVVLCAAGNNTCFIDLPSTVANAQGLADDYNNYWREENGLINYHFRGMTPGAFSYDCLPNVLSSQQVLRANNAIIVGSLDINNYISSFTNRGPRIDIFAPGGSIQGAGYTRSADNYEAQGARTVPDPSGKSVTYQALGITVPYTQVALNGTSMACPQVSGVLALWAQLRRANNQTITQGEARSAITTGNFQILGTLLEQRNPPEQFWWYSLMGSVNRVLSISSATVQYVDIAPPAIQTLKFFDSIDTNKERTSFREGEAVIFKITTMNISNGTVFNWFTDKDNDIIPSRGTVTLTNNLATGAFLIKEDLTTEGTETIQIFIEQPPNITPVIYGSFSVLDTSTAPTTVTPVVKNNSFKSFNLAPAGQINFDALDAHNQYYILAPTNNIVVNFRGNPSTSFSSLLNSSSITLTIIINRPRFNSFLITGFKIDGVNHYPTYPLGRRPLFSFSSAFRIIYELTFDRNGSTIQSVCTVTAHGDDPAIAKKLTLNPSFYVYPSLTNVGESESVQFTLVTENVPNGTVYDYAVVGSNISLFDFEQPLTGKVTVTNNRGIVVLTTRRDSNTENNDTYEFHILEAGVVLASTRSQFGLLRIRDNNATYSISRVGPTPVNEGVDVIFNITTRNVPPGAKIPYMISGVSSNDIGVPTNGFITVINPSFKKSNVGEVGNWRLYPNRQQGSITQSVYIRGNDVLIPVDLFYAGKLVNGVWVPTNPTGQALRNIVFAYRDLGYNVGITVTAYSFFHRINDGKVEEIPAATPQIWSQEIINSGVSFIAVSAYLLPDDAPQVILNGTVFWNEATLRQLCIAALNLFPSTIIKVKIILQGFRLSSTTATRVTNHNNALLELAIPNTVDEYIVLGAEDLGDDPAFISMSNDFSETTVTSFTIPIRQDGSNEGSETLTLKITGPAETLEGKLLPITGSLPTATVSIRSNST